jgi:hypothetical protein
MRSGHEVICLMKKLCLSIRLLVFVVEYLEEADEI